MATSYGTRGDSSTGIAQDNTDISITSVDRVRWGAVIAGLFAAITVLVVLAIAGLAVNFSTFTPGTNAGNLLVGTGVWGAFSALIAFAVGGGTAARTAAVHGRGNGTLNGAMVFMVAIPLLLYTLLGGVGSLLNTATNVAATGAQVAAPAVQAGANAAANNPAVQATAQTAGAQIQATAQTAVGSVTSQQVKDATNTASSAALSVLLWLGLGLLASIFGGYIGSRSENVVVARTTTTVPPTR